MTRKVEQWLNQNSHRRMCFKVGRLLYCVHSFRLKTTWGRSSHPTWSSHGRNHHLLSTFITPVEGPRIWIKTKSLNKKQKWQSKVRVRIAYLPRDIHYLCVGSKTVCPYVGSQTGLLLIGEWNLFESQSSNPRHFNLRSLPEGKLPLLKVVFYISTTLIHHHLYTTI